ncbi:protease HtpX [Candidatus Woesearchaeota archaeon]|nr:MAG: protease HtpX [Candidatus Woesearchaeota archaeon]
MWNQIKTALLLGALSGLIIATGKLLFGMQGLTLAAILAIALNFGMYFFSHKLVLKMYKAMPATRKEHPQMHKIIEELSKEIKLPKPKLYIIPTSTPNAFATGPNPKKAVVACTQGILSMLDERELRGVLAHEMSHIKNRDMLVTTIAATMSAIISYIAQMAQFAAIFGGRDEGGAMRAFSTLAIAITTPIIAAILQLAISRSREYLADERGAKTTKDAKALASALLKLERGCKQTPLQGNSATSSLFIINPFKTQGLQGLFSTHPPTSKRVERLERIQQKIQH